MPSSFPSTAWLESTWATALAACVGMVGGDRLDSRLVIPAQTTIPTSIASELMASTNLDHPNGLPRFTLRSMLATVAGTASALAAYISFGSFGLATAMLGIGMLLRTILRRRNQHTGIAMFLIISSSMWCCLCVVGWTLLGYGPVLSKNSWPLELREMIDISDADPNYVRVSGLGAFIDSEHAWSMQIDRKGLEKIETKFGITQTNFQSVPLSFWHAFPGWWRPSPSKEMIYLTTPNFPAWRRGLDGCHFFAAFDPSTKLLFVWHKNNF